MFGHVFGHNLIKKYVIYFGTLFNDLYVNRDKDGEVYQTIKVPLSYAPKEKFLARLEGDPNFERPAMVLPRMSFEIVNMEYDPTRKLNTMGKLCYTADDGSMSYAYNPVPYNIYFNLYIMVKNAEDGTRIIEQILPFFAPEYTATLRLIPELNVTQDVPVAINKMDIQDLYEGSFQERRVLVWTLTFTMKAFLFGPVRTANNVIRKAIVDFVEEDHGGLLSKVTVTPGLTANGEPTSNAAASINYNLINADDNYGFITDFSDGE